MEIIKFEKSDLGLNPGMIYSLYDTWGRRTVPDTGPNLLDRPRGAGTFPHRIADPGRLGGDT